MLPQPWQPRSLPPHPVPIRPLPCMLWPAVLTHRESTAGVPVRSQSYPVSFHCRDFRRDIFRVPHGRTLAVPTFPGCLLASSFGAFQERASDICAHPSPPPSPLQGVGGTLWPGPVRILLPICGRPPSCWVLPPWGERGGQCPVPLGPGLQGQNVGTPPATTTTSAAVPLWGLQEHHKASPALRCPFHKTGQANHLQMATRDGEPRVRAPGPESRVPRSPGAPVL